MEVKTRELGQILTSLERALRALTGLDKYPEDLTGRKRRLTKARREREEKAGRCQHNNIPYNYKTS